MYNFSKILAVSALVFSMNNVARSEDIPSYPLKTGEGKWNYTNQAGDKFVLPVAYEDALEFHETGLAPVLLKGKAAYINHQGKIVFKTNSEKAAQYIDEVGIYQVTENPLDSDKQRSMLIDKTGKIITPWYKQIEIYQDGFFIVSNHKNKYGVINAQGKEIIKPSYDGIKTHGYGLFTVCNTSLGNSPSQCGVINAKGTMLVQMKTQYIGAYHKAGDKFIAQFGPKDKVGYMDEKGNVIIPAKFERVMDFEPTGVACAMESKDEDLYGVIDLQGKWIAKPQFEKCGDNYSLNQDHPVIKYESDGNTGLINTQTGKILIKAQYSFLEDFNKAGFARATLNDKNGLIDVSGKVIVPFKYQQTSWDGDLFVAYDDESKANIFSKNFKLVKGNIRDFTGFGKNGLAGFCESKGQCGYINTQGVVVIPPTFKVAKGFAKRDFALVQTQKNECFTINASGKTMLKFTCDF